MRNTKETQEKEMKGKKYKWNKGLLTVYALILLPFVVIWVVGWIYIRLSLVQIFYSLSSGLICLGLIYVFTASIYQKYVYAFKLGSKYNKQKNELDTDTSETKDDKPWGDKAFEFIYKFRIFPSQQFWFFVLLVFGIIVSLIPYQNWYGAESALDIIIIFRKTMQDDIYIKVLKYCVCGNQASVSVIQRRFPVGYIKACKIFDWMVEKNYVAKQSRNRPAKVLMTYEEFKNIYGDIDD